MSGLGVEPQLYEIFIRFAINVSAMLLLTFGMCYPRYKDKELVTAASMFNVFVFAVLITLSSVQFSLAAGFGLFAILALFTLRSEQISKIEITYFFGSVSIAVICAVDGTSVGFVLVTTALVLLGAYVIDHPRVLRSASSMKLTLDRVVPHALSDPGAMQAELSEQLGVQVVSYRITAIDYINDMMRVDVYYRKV